MFGSGSEVLENEHEGGSDDFIEEAEDSHSHMHSNWLAKRALSH